MLPLKRGKDGIYCRYIKRGLDILCALAAMIVFCWLYGIIAILVRVKLGSPVIFKQLRPGKDEKIFCLYKFRTMTDKRDDRGKLLPDEQRLTKFGKWLRSTSLDELPEAWNILKGDMSVVGPRPLLVEYLERYDDRQRHRQDVRPGLSGYAQIHGRNAISWEKRFELDVWYTENVSLWLDIRIVMKTVVVAMGGKNISSETSATMEEFMNTPVGVGRSRGTPK